MSLHAKGDAGARGLAQKTGNTIHALLSLRAQRLGDFHLSGGELHFHGQPPLLVPNAIPPGELLFFPPDIASSASKPLSLCGGSPDQKTANENPQQGENSICRQAPW